MRSRAATGVAAWTTTIAVATAAAALPPGAAVGATAPSSQAAPNLLDVPYVAQSEALCGGAAAAMVQRYWGDDRAGPEDFRHLVDVDAGGIPTAALERHLRRSGWIAHALRGDPAEMARQVELGRPPVALVEVAPDRHHYVVIVAWAAGRVVYHDPAVAPWQVSTEEEFLAAWEPTSAWSLILLPDRAESAEPTAAEMTSPPTAASPSVVPLLAEASEAFRSERWVEVEELARRAAGLEPANEQAWRLLGAALYLQDRDVEALGAWNRVGEPVADGVDVHGLRRTRHPVVAGLLDDLVRASQAGRGAGAVDDVSPAGARPALLRPGSLLLARRRLEEQPFVVAADVRYAPPTRGRTRLQAHVVERPRLPGSPVELAALATRSLARREVRLSLSSPAGAGSVWTGGWRWRDGRERLSLEVGMPAPASLGDVWTVELSRDGGTFEALAGGDARPGPAVRKATADSERREHVGLRARGWWSGEQLWEIDVGLDEWRRHGAHLALGGALERRLRDDRVALRGDAGAWVGVDGGRGFVRAAVDGAWRSGTDGRGGGGWLVTAGTGWTSRSAPLLLWPGAGADAAAHVPLRAHRLLEDGIIRSRTLGRRLVHGSVEYRHWLGWLGPLRVGAAGFADSARLWRRPDGDSSASLLDIGAGARLAFPGAAGSFRVDLARGVRDGDMALSVGWQPGWPPWERD